MGSPFTTSPTSTWCGTGWCETSSRRTRRMGIERVNLREELERSTEESDAARRSRKAPHALRLLLLLAVSLLTTVALGGALRSRAAVPMAAAFAVNLLLFSTMVAAL